MSVIFSGHTFMSEKSDTEAAYRHAHFCSNYNASNNASNYSALKCTVIRMLQHLLTNICIKHPLIVF